MSANVVRLEELGHGATGSVYKAVHATTLQLLAVKEVWIPESWETWWHINVLKSLLNSLAVGTRG